MTGLLVTLVDGMREGERLLGIGGRRTEPMVEGGSTLVVPAAALRKCNCCKHAVRALPSATFASRRDAGAGAAFEVAADEGTEAVTEMLEANQRQMNIHGNDGFDLMMERYVTCTSSAELSGASWGRPALEVSP